MAEDLISSLFDTAAIDKESVLVIAKIDALAAKLGSFPKADVFAGVSSTKEQSDAQKQLSAVLDQLKVKNLELTVAQKQLSIAQKQAAVDAKAEADARRATIQLAKDQAAADKEASKQAQISGREKILALRQQQEAQEALAEAEKTRQAAEEQALTGTYTTGSSAKNKTTAAASQFIPATESDALALSLIQDQRQLQATKDAQKLLTAEFKAGNVTQAEYDAQLVKSVQLQQDLKVSIANTTKELSTQAKANASIPGTIEGLQTRNTVLGQQAKQINVVNASPEDIASLKSVNDEIDKNNELIRINSDLLKQQKINIGNYPNAFGTAFKTLNTELDAVQGKLVSGNFSGKQFDELTAKSNVLKNATSLVGKEFSTVAQQQKAYAEASTEIGLVYGKNSKVFKDFSSGVKEGNVSIKSLASAVTDTANKGKGFVGFLSNAYGAIRKLAYAIPGIGIGGIVLLLLGPLQAAGAALIKWSDNATKAGRDFQDLQRSISDTNAIVEKSSQAFSDATSQVSKLKEDVALARQGFLDKNKVLKEYNDTMGKTTGKLTNIDDLEKKLIADGPDYIKLLFLKAEATAAYALAGEAARKSVTAQQDAEKDFGLGDQALLLFKNLGTVIKGAVGNQSKAFASLSLAGVKQIKKNGDDIKTEQDKAYADFIKKGDEFEAAGAKKAKEKGWNFFPDDTKGKGAAKTHLQELKAIMDNEFEIYKVNQQRKIALFDEISKDTTKSFTDRLTALQNYTEAEQELLKRQEDYDIANKQRETARDIKHLNEEKAGKSSSEKKRIDENIKIDQDNLTSAILLIQKKYGVDSLSIEDKTAKSRKAIVKEEYDYIRDTGIRAYEDIAAAIDKTAKEADDRTGIAKNNKLIQLDKDLQSGKIKDLDDYDKQRREIEDAATIEEKLNDEKKILAQAAIFGYSLDLQKKFSDDELAIEDLKNKKILEKDKDLADARRQLRDQLEQTFQDIIDGGFDKQKDQNDAKITSIQNASQKEIDAINASGLAQSEKDRRTMASKKQADFQTQQIEERQKKQDLEKAKFDRAMSIVRIIQSTAESVAKAIAQFPITAGQPFVSIDLAIGAAQLASVLAQPLPKYKTGTESAKKGPAIVSEEGSELMIRNGKMFLTPSAPSLIELAGGEKIFNHSVTKDMLAHMNMIEILASMNNKKNVAKLPDNYNEKMYRELRQLNGKPPFIINVSEKFETTDIFRRHFKP